MNRHGQSGQIVESRPQATSACYVNVSYRANNYEFSEAVTAEIKVGLRVSCSTN